jgi:hypothetical protein
MALSIGGINKIITDKGLYKERNVYCYCDKCKVETVHKIYEKECECIICYHSYLINIKTNDVVKSLEPIEVNINKWKNKPQITSNSPQQYLLMLQH